MTGYNIFLSDGDLLTTINVKTIDEQAHSSLILIGQGIPDYGTAIAQDFVWLMENFSKSTPPVHPLVGQQWYDRANDRMNFFTGSEWRYYGFSENAFATRFDMAGASQNVDFTTTGTTAIFTGANASKTYCPTNFILIPRGAFTATTPATINMSIVSSGDVVFSTTVPIIAANHFVKRQTNQEALMVVGNQTLNLNITTAAGGGQLNYDVYVYGAVF